MDSNGSPLQAINSVRGDYYRLRPGHEQHIDTVQATSWKTYGLAAYLPTCLPAWDPFGSLQTNLSSGPGARRSRDQVRNESLGPNPTEYKGAEYLEADPISFTRANKETQTDMSHFG